MCRQPPRLRCCVHSPDRYRGLDQSAKGKRGIMKATTGAAWNVQANNSHYRITELVLPPLTSAGLRRFEFKATLLPHMAGQLLVKSQDQERNTEVTAGRLIEFESGTESEILSMTDQELRFTMIEFK